jgi:5-methyltetrahydropteroyltriglutamate--homocysteine methyltransferase
MQWRNFLIHGDNVNVKVKYYLTSNFAVILHDSDAFSVFSSFYGMSHFLNNLEQMRHFFLRNLENVLVMFLGYHQRVTHIDGAVAQKSHDFFILINKACWCFSTHYLAECAWLNHERFPFANISARYRSLALRKSLTVRTIGLKEFGGQYAVMEPLVDDVGSFPLPPAVNRETFDRAYCLAREAIINGRDPKKDDFLSRNFCAVTLDAFKKKSLAGLDVVNYPQQYDGIRQVSDAIHVAMAKGTFVVEEKHAFLPEVHLIGEEAKRLSEELGKKIRLRVCIFGPLEQYLKEIGTVPYSDVLESYAETIRRFAQNSVLNLKHVKTEVVSIDEPSFGFANIAAGKDKVCEVLEKAFDFQGAVRQIHLHSPSRLADLLGIRNIDVLSFEYAASPKNIEGVSRKMLEDADKQIRVGVSRTDIDSIVAELHDSGVVKPTAEQIVDGEDAIRERYVTVKEKYGDKLTFTGPDCGLGSWPSQEAALLLLGRTVKAVKTVKC